MIERCPSKIESVYLHHPDLQCSHRVGHERIKIEFDGMEPEDDEWWDHENDAFETFWNDEAARQ